MIEDKAGRLTFTVSHIWATLIEWNNLSNDKKEKSTSNNKKRLNLCRFISPENGLKDVGFYMKPHFLNSKYYFFWHGFI